MTDPVLPLEELSREALIAQVRGLLARISALEAEIERLKREGKRQASPFSKGERKPDPKPPGRKPGKGPFRFRSRPAPEEITAPPVLVPLPTQACPECGGLLEEERLDLCWRTELPPLPRPEVMEYRVTVARCTGCGKRVRGSHPDVAQDQRGASAHRLGPRLLAAAHVLHYGVGLPLRRVPGVLQELCGARVTQGALTQAALRQAEKGARSAYELLKEEVPAAPAVHTDGTGWRVAGEAAQLAVFETAEATLYQITPRHTNEEVRAVVGDDYSGVMITDRGRQYDARLLRGVRQQKCLSHVLRNLSEVARTKKGPSRRFTTKLSALLREALSLWTKRRAGEVEEALYWDEVARLGREVTRQLRDRAFRDRDNQRLLNELGRQHDQGHLLRFLDEPDTVEPTNNAAERALRPAVIARKVSHCSKTWPAAAAHAIFTSLIRTSTKRDVRSVVDSLMRILETGQPPPNPAIV